MTTKFREVKWLAQGHTVSLTGDNSWISWKKVTLPEWVTWLSESFERRYLSLKGWIGVCQWQLNPDVENTGRSNVIIYVRAIKSCAPLWFLLCPSSGQPYCKWTHLGHKWDWDRRVTESVLIHLNIKEELAFHFCSRSTYTFQSFVAFLICVDIVYVYLASKANWPRLWMNFRVRVFYYIPRF